jgi:hypothetical protein
MDRKNAEEHIRNHVTYPTTGDAIMKSCSNLEHFSAEDKKWMSEHLPMRRYETPESVIRALGW